MPFGIQPIHLIIIAIAALLIFGPARLPEIGRSIGRGLNEFRRGAKEMTENFAHEINPDASQPDPSAGTPLPPAQAAVTSPPVIVASINCPQCGTSNPAQARFCNHCGANLEQA